MPNLVEVNYERTGRSTNTDWGSAVAKAMARQVREMQARADLEGAVRIAG